MTTRRIARAAAAALLVVSAGCGGPAPAGEAVPALRTHLSHVDAALADGKYAAARTALDALTRETITARAAGRLTPEQADRILAAAARLTADLPTPPPTPKPTVTVQVPTEREPGGEQGGKKGGEDRDDDDDDGRGGKGGKNGKGGKGSDDDD
jgi:hypothetical protein